MQYCFYSDIATGHFLFCNTHNASKYYTRVMITTGEVHSHINRSPLLACLNYTEYVSSIFSSLCFFFSRVLNELDEDELKIEYTTRTYLLNSSWKYMNERMSA